MVKKYFVVLFIFFWVILLVFLSNKIIFVKNNNYFPALPEIILPTQTPSPSIVPTLTSIPTPTNTLIPTPTSKVNNIVPNPSLTISIIGDENCKSRTYEALNLLEEKASTHALIIKKYIGIIECVDKGSGMVAQETPPRFKVGLLTLNAGSIWYAGSIVHDSCHSKLYYDALVNNGNVYSDDWTGKVAESKCIAIQYDALEKIGADQKTLDYLKSVIDTNYWDISDRWW